MSILPLLKITRKIKYEPKTGKAEGFDFGITEDFLIGSNGKTYPSPMFYKRNAKQLAAAQKVHSRKVKGSNNSERERKESCAHS